MVLNREQQEAVENGEPVALNVGGTECVLVRRDIYLRLDPDYDTRPWTTEEMNLLADEAEEMISRREGEAKMNVYDGQWYHWADLPEPVRQEIRVRYRMLNEADLHAGEYQHRCGRKNWGHTCFFWLRRDQLVDRVG
jgi:hypothetical protein